MKNKKNQPKLYSLYSVWPEMDGYIDVPITWLHPEREEPPVPYELIIEGYKDIEQNNRCYPESRVDELFTEEEATELSQFLLKGYGVHASWTEEELPISSNTMGLSMLPSDTRNSLFYWWPDGSEENPSPSFLITGFYSKRGCKLKEDVERDYMEVDPNLADLKRLEERSSGFNEEDIPFR